MRAAADNLVATYLAIGRNLPGAEVRQTEAYVALVSDLPHPSGNFATRLSLDPWSAGELRELAASRPAFQAIALPDDAPEHLAELLRRAGFAPVQRLVAMVAAAPSHAAGELEMTPCEGEGRRRAGRFMADVFFAREPIPLRETMTRALADALPVTLHTHGPVDRPVAAVALSRTPGALGIYNLGVAGTHRGKGLGSSLVAWCLAQAAADGLDACLQCAPGLEPWYARHGFERTGTISVWSL